jgi:hypothetical protein
MPALDFRSFKLILDLSVSGRLTASLSSGLQSDVWEQRMSWYRKCRCSTLPRKLNAVR